MDRHGFCDVESDIPGEMTLGEWRRRRCTARRASRPLLARVLRRP